MLSMVVLSICYPVRMKIGQDEELEDNAHLIVCVRDQGDVFLFARVSGWKEVENSAGVFKVIEVLNLAYSLCGFSFYLLHKIWGWQDKRSNDRTLNCS